MPATDKAIELFVTGDYGPIRTLLGVYPISVPPGGSRALRENDVNQLMRWTNSCHPLAFLVAVGGPVVGVTVHHARLGGGVCVLQHESGAVGTLHLAAGGNGTQPLERYMVFGESAHLSVDNVTRVTLQRGIPFEYGRTVSFAPQGTDTGAVTWEPQNMLSTLENMSLFTQGVYAEMRYFCDCVLAEQKAERGSLEFALHLMRIYEAALMSTGDCVAVPT
jgi:hypothetical protein